MYCTAHTGCGAPGIVVAIIKAPFMVEMDVDSLNWPLKRQFRRLGPVRKTKKECRVRLSTLNHRVCL